MRGIGLILACFIGFFVSTQALAVPAEFKKELAGINKVIQNATTQVIYKKKYEGMAEELDRATQMLKDLSAKAGIDETDSDIKRALKRIEDTREKLDKALAKQGKVPQARQPSGAAQQSDMAAFKKDLGEVNSVVRSAKGTIYNSDTLDGMAEELDKADGMLTAVVQKYGKAETDSDIDRMRKSIAESRAYLEKKLAKQSTVPGAVTSKSGFGAPKESTKTPGAVTSKSGFGAPKASTHTPGSVGEMKPTGAKPAATASAPADDWSAQNAIFDRYKQRIRDLNALVKKLARTDDVAEFRELARESKPLFEQSREVVAAIHDGIADLRKFQGVNAEAKEINFRNLVVDLEENLLKRAEHKVEMEVSGILNEADSELFSLKQANRPNLAAISMDRIKAGFELLDAIAPGDPKVAEEKARILPEAEKLYAAALEKVASTKMASENFSGDDADAVKADIAKLYAAKYGDGTVERVVITSNDWKEQAVAEVNNDNEIVAGYYKYLYADVAVKKAKGCVVYPMGFRKAWTGTGEDYGPLEIRSVGVSYPILAENIGK